MNYEMAQEMGVNRTYGWRIVEVVSGGPSDKKLEVDDIIIAMNETCIKNGDDLASYLEENTLPGQTVIFTIVRGSQTLEISVVLGQRPPPPV